MTDNTSVSKAPESLSDAQLAGMSSLDDAQALLESMGVKVENLSDFGTGFEIADKARLVGNPFIIITGSIHDGDWGPFCSLAVMTKSGEKLIINDGSTGIYRQVADLIKERGTVAGLACNHGLRVSEYEVELPNGNTTQATTYYLDTSK